MSESRERDQRFENALLCSPRFNSGDPEVDRQTAIDWGEAAYTDEVTEPFTPSGHGALDAGFWPADCQLLITLNKKGRLPDSADLSYGVTVNKTNFHGIRRLEDSSFIAVISGEVAYANKVEEPASEPATETEANGAEDATDRAAQDG